MVLFISEKNRCEPIFHISYTFKRLEPILARIKEYPNALVCPTIDTINPFDLHVTAATGHSYGTFYWV
jgi:hypothetical protein